MGRCIVPLWEIMEDLASSHNIMWLMWCCLGGVLICFLVFMVTSFVAPLCHPHFLAVDQQPPGPLISSRFFHQSLPCISFLETSFQDFSAPILHTPVGSLFSQAEVFCLWSLALGIQAFEIIFLKLGFIFKKRTYNIWKVVRFRQQWKVNIHCLSFEGCN